MPTPSRPGSTGSTCWRDQAWPRNTHLEVAGIQIQRTASTDGTVSLSDLIPFDETREIKVAKGTSVLLKVPADATKVIPEYCTDLLPHRRR